MLNCWPPIRIIALEGGGNLSNRVLFGRSGSLGVLLWFIIHSPLISLPKAGIKWASSLFQHWSSHDDFV